MRKREAPDVRIWINDVELLPARPEYLDQAPHHDGIVSAVLTPAGIGQLEEAYANRIMEARSKTALLKVRRDLKADKHLHRTIKSNLLLNIRSYLRRAV